VEEDLTALENHPGILDVEGGYTLDATAADSIVVVRSLPERINRVVVQRGRLPEAADDDSFFLWVGEMMLPWLQEEAEEDVVSPANLPEFMERMEQIWLLRHGPESIQS